MTALRNPSILQYLRSSISDSLDGEQCRTVSIAVGATGGSNPDRSVAMPCWLLRPQVPRPPGRLAALQTGTLPIQPGTGFAGLSGQRGFRRPARVQAKPLQRPLPSISPSLRALIPHACDDPRKAPTPLQSPKRFSLRRCTPLASHQMLRPSVRDARKARDHSLR